jgi:hypothetical protein
MIASHTLTDLELILLVLAALYFSECSCWIPETAMCVCGVRRHRTAVAMGPLANEHGRLVLTNLLPWSFSFVCSAWPLPFDARGIVLVPGGGIQDANGGRNDLWLPYEAISSITTEERKLLINGRVVAKLFSAAGAVFVATRLDCVRRATPAKREQAAEAVLADITDTVAISGRLRRLKIERRALTDICTAFAIYAFVVGPALYYAGALNRAWSAATYLASFLAIWACSIAYYCAMYRSFIRGSRMIAVSRMVMLLLSPAAAMRAAESIARGCFDGYEPVAVASVICQQRDLRKLAEQRLRELCAQPQAPVVASSEDRALLWFQERVALRLRMAVEEAGLDPRELLAEPVRMVDAQSYCPRCLTQYTLDHGSCESCNGLALQSWTPQWSLRKAEV